MQPRTRFATRLTSVHLFTISALLGMGQASAVQAEPKAEPRTALKVAILIFPGVELLDFTGPAEVFIIANQRSPFQVYTVSESPKMLKTMGGIQVVPNHTTANAPQPDILVVPGGAMSNVGTVGRKWLRERAAKSKIVMSVCMGAFLLADAGLLDGKQVTTHRWAQAQLQTKIPSCTVVSDRRFVDSGHVVSTGGVTAGIDGALHVVERLAGRKTAQWTAEEWMEYRGYKPRQRSTSILKNP